MRVLRRAWGDTWKLFSGNWKRKFLWGLIVSLGFSLAFFVLEKEKLMDEFKILALFTVVPFGVVFLGVFLWNLWLAPYRIVNEKLDSMKANLGRPKRIVGWNPLPTNPDQWKHAEELELYQVAEVSGGRTPAAVSYGSTDTACAIYSELLAALRSGTLKGSDKPDIVGPHTRIKRKDLQEYFAGRKEKPEFLCDEPSED